MKLRVIQRKTDEPIAIRVLARRPEVHAPAVFWPKAAAVETVKRWHGHLDLTLPDAKKMTPVKDDLDRVIDYRDVRIAGYLSTFQGTTESDRQGDYVEEGAFAGTIARFRENPVMLQDHRNQVDSLVGQFTAIREDKQGLYVEGLLSNAPGVTDTRFKVAEGILRTMSMGGIFHYRDNGRGIFAVDLWEGSLTPIPANPDARFSVRSLSQEDAHYMKSAHLFASYYDFLNAVRGGKTMRD